MARQSKRKRNETRFGNAERLADIVHEKNRWGIPAWVKNTKEAFADMAIVRDRITDSISKAKVYVADNVCEYFYANDSKEVWEFDKDFHCCAPPHDSFFIEFARPSRIASEGRILSTNGLPERWGWLVTAIDREEAMRRAKDQEEFAKRRAKVESDIQKLWGQVDRRKMAVFSKMQPMEAVKAATGTELLLIQQVLMYHAMSESSTFAKQLTETAKWICNADLITYSKGIVLRHAVLSYLINDAGRIIDNPLPAVPFAEDLDSDLRGSVAAAFQNMMYPLAMTLCFMHCKKVTTPEQEPDPEINKQRRKAGLKPFIRYHTINIDPMKATLKSEGGIEANGLKRALHICRGHFVTYTEDAPLFGRLTGTYWKPAHVRGSATEGVVFSNYNVKGPQGGTS